MSFEAVKRELRERYEGLLRLSLSSNLGNPDELPVVGERFVYGDIAHCRLTVEELRDAQGEPFEDHIMLECARHNWEEPGEPLYTHMVFRARAEEPFVVVGIPASVYDRGVGVAAGIEMPEGRKYDCVLKKSGLLGDLVICRSRKKS